jgi:hypothetical protein
MQFLRPSCMQMPKCLMATTWFLPQFSSSEPYHLTTLFVSFLLYPSIVRKPKFATFHSEDSMTNPSLWGFHLSSFFEEHKPLHIVSLLLWSTNPLCK